MISRKMLFLLTIAVRTLGCGGGDSSATPNPNTGDATMDGAVIVDDGNVGISDAGSTEDADAADANDASDGDAGDGGPVVQAAPWDGPGITAAEYFETTNQLWLVSDDKIWVITNASSTAQWSSTLSKKASDKWGSTSGLITIDGQNTPWDGPGITALYYVPSGDLLAVFSKDKVWVLSHPTALATDPSPPVWLGASYSRTASEAWGSIASRPTVGGQSAPWDATGITGSYYFAASQLLVLISVDKVWVVNYATNPDTWSTSLCKIASEVWSGLGTPPVVDGQSAPWSGSGITASYYVPATEDHWLISGNKAWVIRDAASGNAAWDSSASKLAAQVYATVSGTLPAL